MTREQELEAAVVKLSKEVQGGKGMFTVVDLLNHLKVDFLGGKLYLFDHNKEFTLPELVLLTRVLTNEYLQDTLKEVDWSDGSLVQ